MDLIREREREDQDSLSLSLFLSQKTQEIQLISDQNNTFPLKNQFIFPSFQNLILSHLQIICFNLFLFFSYLNDFSDPIDLSVLKRREEGPLGGPSRGLGDPLGGPLRGPMPPLVQPGRVRLVMRNGYISRLLGAGEPTFQEFESDSGSESENESLKKNNSKRGSISKVESFDKAVRSLYSIKPISSIPTYGTSYRKPRSIFIGPKSGDPAVNEARYQEFVTHTQPIQLRSIPISHQSPKQQQTYSNPIKYPMKSPSTISHYESPSIQESETQIKPSLRPKSISKSGALISKIKSSLEFKASGSQMKGLNIGIESSQAVPEIKKIQTSKCESSSIKTPSRLSNFFNKVLRKTPKEMKEEKSLQKTPIHCQTADQRVIHGFTVQKPTVVAEFDKTLPKSPKDSPKSMRRASIKSTKSNKSTQKVEDPLSQKPSPSLRLRKFFKRSTSKEKIDSKEQKEEPKPGSPKTLVQVERKDNGRFIVPELKRVTSPVMKPKYPLTPPQYSFATSGKAYNRKEYSVKPKIEAPLIDLNEMESWDKTRSLEKPMGIVRPFSRTGNPNDRNIRIGPLPRSISQISTPQSQSSRVLSQKKSIPIGRPRTDPPPIPRKERKASEREERLRLDELEAQLKVHHDRLEELSRQPLIEASLPITVTEKRVLVRYDDNLIRKPQRRREGDSLTRWIVQPSPLTPPSFMEKRGLSEMSPHSKASLSLSSSQRPLSPTSPSNLFPKSPRDLLNPIPNQSNKPIPLWRLQNHARFGKDKTKSLTSPISRKEDEGNSHHSPMAKSTPSSLLSADKGGTEEESAVSFHTPPPEPIINVAPPTPVSSKKPLDIETSSDKKKIPKTLKDTKLNSPTCIPWDSSFELAEVYSDASVMEDESQYSAITHFIPKKIKKPPVPGMWLKDGVELISKNKHFKREEEAHTTVFIYKSKRLERITNQIKISSNKNMEKKKMVMRKKRVTEINGKDLEKAIKEREISPILARKNKDSLKSIDPVIISISAILQNKIISKQTTLKKWPHHQRESVINRKPFKVKRKSIPLALALVDRELMRRSQVSSIQKTLPLIKKEKETNQLKCKTPTQKTTKTEQNLSRNQASGGAKVIVVSAPIDNVNVSRIKHKCKASKVKKERNSMPCYSSLEQSIGGLEEEKQRIRSIQANNGAHSDTEYDNEGSSTPRLRREGSVAAAILDQMRGKDSAVDWSKENGASIFLNLGGEPLILPDQSILEEYIKRKRGRLERLHSEPIPETDENRSECESPCNSTASEFVPASAVRVHEPSLSSSRGIPVITTAPQKSRSRMSSGEPHTPTAMIETQTSLNNFNSTPQAFLRHDRRAIPRPILFQAPQSFDLPKTPFESALQQQANQIARRASINSLSTYSEPGECRSETGGVGSGHVRQNSQDGSISSSFTNALAANQPPRHERYAAHIPVNRGDGSGRQSANSVDSQASGALETASKQLDQVIDQARYRHHQHRSRFKEAIDYLDQIFEDLKRECDTGAQQASAAAATLDDEANNNKSQSDIEPPPPAPTISKEATRRPQPAVLVTDPAPSYATQSLPNRSTKHRPQNKPPSPAEAVFKKQKESEVKQKKSPDSEIAETIILPKKPDKLDFTRKWLQDDLSSFGMSSPAPLVIGPEMTLYTDVDEHSLGSCSAEVAAINENSKTKKKEKKNSQSKPKPHADVKPVKPQALRPQPQYPSGSGGNNGPRQFPVDFEPAPPLPRVASFDHMSERVEQNGWRSGSQEPYNNSLSLHPNDPRPSPSAFQNVSPSVQRNSLRGSIRSLSDAGRVPSLRPTPDPPRDPGLAIDALVAELELNTEESALAEKRRSFPTTIGRLNEYEQPKPRVNPPTQPRRTTQPVNYSHGYQQPPAPSQPILPSSNFSNSMPNRPQIQKQANLDEMASMLTSVANEFSPETSQNPQSRQQNGHRGSLPRQDSAGASSNQSYIYAVPHMHAPPFETINKERINPSRVEAMQNVFETRPTNTEWRRGPQPYKSPSREEENYYEIGDLQQSLYQPLREPTNNRQAYKNSTNNNFSVSHDCYPQYPSSQPPTIPPVGRNGSAGSSQNGGYYSSNSSDHHQNGNHQGITRRGSLAGRQSINSRAQSQEEDDGFYDNIAHGEDRRFSRGSDVFETGSLNRTASTKSHTHGKIGSFFRKIGSGRPPGAAASLVSLNKAGIEPIIQPAGPLMKSSSLSQDPWNKHVLGGPSLPSPNGDKNKGIGQRLKNSFFGSKKRLNG